MSDKYGVKSFDASISAKDSPLFKAGTGFEPVNNGFADRRLRPLGYPAEDKRLKKKNGAGNGIRTRDTRLGKAMLYQLSYSRTLILEEVLQI